MLQTPLYFNIFLYFKSTRLANSGRITGSMRLDVENLNARSHQFKVVNKHRPIPPQVILNYLQCVLKTTKGGY